MEDRYELLRQIDKWVADTNSGKTHILENSLCIIDGQIAYTQVTTKALIDQNET